MKFPDKLAATGSEKGPSPDDRGHQLQKIIPGFSNKQETLCVM